MKLLVTFVVTLISAVTFSQNISGKAYYESKTTVKMDEIGRKGMDENMKKMIAERMKQYLEKTYILTFNGNESIYKEEEKLETGAGGGMMSMMMGSFSPGVQYKNIETKQILEEREFFGKQFLINDTIANLEWILEKESKQIGQYVAFKATAVQQIDANDLTMARRRKSDDKKEEDEKEATETKTDSSEVKDPFDEIEIPKEVIVTAWYTPMIPVKNGPGEYAGLPGLILELNVYRTTILCSKIVMNPKEAEEIKAPKKGKEVTRAEYNKIIKDKMDEMRENFRNSGGRRGGMRGGN
ncbi:MAG: GLPGLI family protein [Flavobacteriaceae bacterium]|nr:GLPGLI family protein [Flavobacteriaceae bacterium]